MSAPSLLDRLMAQSVGPLAESSLPQRFTHASDRRDRRSRAAVLSREHDALCCNATDPLEIAAGLEAAGISDRRARASYDAATVFELAEKLYRQVPRRPLTVARADPWARPKRELMARGLVYGLPGLLLVAAVLHLVAAEALLLLLVCVVTAGANQALSWLYYLLLGRKQLAAAAALLRQALAVSVVGGATVAWLSIWMGAASLPGAAVTALAAIYLVSATVVLLLDRHRLLLSLLIPAAALSLLAIFVPHQLLPGEVALVADIVSVLSVVGALVTAWRLAGDRAGAEEPGRVVPLTRSDLVGCLHLFAHGCLSMSLLSLIPLTSLRSGSSTAEALGPVMLPAMLSLGAAEVLMYGFRQRAVCLLAGNRPRPFARAARLHLLSRVTSYTLLLATLTAAVAVVGRRSLEVDANATGHLLTYLLLCVALFVASLLVSTGYVRTVTMIEAAALMLDVALSHQPIVSASLTSTGVHLGSAAALVAVMLVFGSTFLGRVVSYR
jgi:hypothetical protein